MVAPQALGTKRTCPQCAARFYDMNKNPATCPKCAASFDTSAPVRTRRSRTEREKRVAELLDDKDDMLLKASKAKAALRNKSAEDEDEVEDLGDMDEVETLAGSEIEPLDDMEELEVITDIENDEEDVLDDDITLEDEDISGETLIDDVEDIEMEDDADDEGASSAKKPKGRR